MATKIFLDTNVIIDFFDPQRLQHSNAVKLFIAMENDEIDGFVSESVLNTSVYLLQKQFSITDLRQILSNLLSFITLLPCSSSNYKDSLKLPGNDIEDAVLYQLALANKLDYFLTEDKKLFKAFSVGEIPVLTIKDFLNINK